MIFFMLIFLWLFQFIEICGDYLNYNDRELQKIELPDFPVFQGGDLTRLILVNLDCKSWAHKFLLNKTGRVICDILLV